MSDDAVCPTCGKEFANQHGMRIHHATAHDESLVDGELTTCDHCGDEYQVPPGATGQYCSLECRNAGMREGKRVDCETCGESFHAANWELERGQGRFCSHDCYAESLENRDTSECAGCGRNYSTFSAANIRYCSRACMAEDRTAAPRPDDLDGLLWVLAVYEDHNARATWLRANHHTDDWLTQKDVKDRLRDNGWMGGGGDAKYSDLTLEDVGLANEPDDPEQTWKKYYQTGGSQA